MTKIQKKKAVLRSARNHAEALAAINAPIITLKRPDLAPILAPHDRIGRKVDILPPLGNFILSGGRPKLVSE